MVDAYLASERLVGFNDKYQEFIAKAGSKKKLRASIDIANRWIIKTGADRVFHAKQSLVTEASTDHSHSPAELQTVLNAEHPQKFCEQQFQEKQFQYSRKYQISEQPTQHSPNLSEMTPELIKSMKVETQNVLELLESGWQRVNNNALGYHKRKLINDFKLKLKDTLLAKYKLNIEDTPKQKVFQTLRGPKTHKIFKRRRHLKNIKAKLVELSKESKKMAILKLHSVMKKRGVASTMAKAMSEEMVEYLLEESSEGFKKQYIELLRWIYNNSSESIVGSYRGFLGQLCSREEGMLEETTQNGMQIVLQPE